jgi:hypothetical protein
MKYLSSLLLLLGFLGLSSCEKDNGGDSLAPGNEVAAVNLKFLVGHWAQHETKGSVANFIRASTTNAEGLVFSPDGNAMRVQFSASASSEKEGCGVPTTTTSSAGDQVNTYMKIIEAGKWTLSKEGGDDLLRIDFAKPANYKINRLNPSLLQLQSVEKI